MRPVAESVLGALLGTAGLSIPSMLAQTPAPSEVGGFWDMLWKGGPTAVAIFVMLILLRSANERVDKKEAAQVAEREEARKDRIAAEERMARMSADVATASAKATERLADVCEEGLRELKAQRRV